MRNLDHTAPQGARPTQQLSREGQMTLSSTELTQVLAYEAAIATKSKGLGEVVRATQVE